MKPETSTKNFNRKLSKLATKLRRTNVVSADLSRNYLNRYGLHLKNSGKEEIANRVVEALRTTQGKSTESISISLTLKDNHTQTKESQVHKSSVANIRMYVIINQLISPLLRF